MDGAMGGSFEVLMLCLALYPLILNSTDSHEPRMATYKLHHDYDLVLTLHSS